jgi:hypothetical protein
MACARCKEPDAEESCWYCAATLCAACWDDYGECGHEAAPLTEEFGRLASRGFCITMPLDELRAIPLDTLRGMVALARTRLR